MAQPVLDRYTSVSWHAGSEEIPKGTLKRILKDVDMTWDDFEKLL